MFDKNASRSSSGVDYDVSCGIAALRLIGSAFGVVDGSGMRCGRRGTDGSLLS
jgi:hypothetical protein